MVYKFFRRLFIDRTTKYLIYESYRAALIQIITFSGLISVILYSIWDIINFVSAGSKGVYYFDYGHLIVATAFFVASYYRKLHIPISHLMVISSLLIAYEFDRLHPQSMSTGLMITIAIIMAALLLNPIFTLLYSLFSSIIVIAIAPGDSSLQNSVLTTLIIVAAFAYLISHIKSLILEENKIQRNQLIHLYESERELFLHLAHRLKTPLTILLTDLNFYEKRNNEQVLNEIKRSAEDINMGIMELVTLSKVHLSKIAADRKQINIIEVVEEVIKDSRVLATSYRSANKTKISFSHNQITELIIYASKASLREALLNLIDNSIRHNLEVENLEVKVEVKLKDKYLAISISDNGVGISEEVIKELMKEDTEHITNHTFESIGLTIVKNIVEANSGRLNIQSTEGKGTTVELLIPQFV